MGNSRYIFIFDLGEGFLRAFRFGFTDREITFLNEVVDHALQTHRTAVVRVINARNAVALKFCNF